MDKWWGLYRVLFVTLWFCYLDVMARSALLLSFRFLLFVFTHLGLFLQHFLKLICGIFMDSLTLFGFLFLDWSTFSFFCYLWRGLFDVWVSGSVTFWDAMLIIWHEKKEVKKPVENWFINFLKCQRFLKILMNVTFIQIKFNWHLIIFVFDSLPLNIFEPLALLNWLKITQSLFQIWLKKSETQIYGFTWSSLWKIQ